MSVNTIVIPTPFENIEWTIKRFKKATLKSDALTLYRRKAEFTPRAERRRVKSNRARARLRKHGRHFDD